MSALTVRQFTDYFEALYGYPPFPWQMMLLERVVNEGWPDLIDLPTAHGKTACMDVALFALAMGLPTPRRIWFVVDRRIVVDEAAQRAESIAQQLIDARQGILGMVAERLRGLGGGKPLEVGRLRGGAPREVAWAGNPAQSAIITSTIDQIGSWLLFRGYGISDFAKSIHAALTGNDSLILLDEAHLARPFYQTVQAIDRFRHQPWAETPLFSPFKLVVMSATPPAEEVNGRPIVRFPLPEERDKAIDHPILNDRREVEKLAELAIAKKPKLPKGTISGSDDKLILDAADRAAKYVVAGRRRVAVMVNRVKTAREIAAQLKQFSPNARIELLTGRLRPVDRDRLIERLKPYLRASFPADPDRPIILVTTQCLEVGADFSFDALVTECASLDSLRQRFGRLARTGKPTDAAAAILIRKSDVKAYEKLDDEDPADPIYGNAMARTWNWLTADGRESIKMGIDALEPLLPGDLSPYSAPRLDAPTLLPAYLDLLSQTSPKPAVEPDISLFLHGIPPLDHRPRVEVRVLWRDDLTDKNQDQWEQLIEGLPPLSAEMLPVPIWEFRRLLLNDTEESEADADIEGGFEPVTKAKSRLRDAAAAPFFIWRYASKCGLATHVGELRPYDVIVLPATSSLYSQLVQGSGLPADVYELAYETTHGSLRRRFRRDPTSDEDTFVDDFLAGLPEDEQNRLSDQRLLEYAPDHFCLTEKAAVLPVDRWESDQDEDDLLRDWRDRSLDGHTNKVKDAIALLSSQLLPGFSSLFQIAAELHDVGKADPRFQLILNRGVRRANLHGLLAKSANRLARWQEQKLYQASKLPGGFRHELLSMQLAHKAVTSNGQASEHPWLLLHLIGSHHGRCRPFAPIVIDETPESVECPTATHGILTLSGQERGETPPHRLDSGVAERFWQLTRRYGWWGLAYLEAILRSADRHASAWAEQEAK